jgi:hypothetical protein
MTGIINVAGEISRKIMGNLYSRNIVFIGLKNGNSCYPSNNPACTASSGGSRDSNSSHDYLWLIGVAIGGIGIVILFALLIKLCVTNRYDNVSLLAD